MTDRTELLPCPFCGSDDIAIKAKRYHGCVLQIQGQKFWYVECLPCDARTGDFFDGDWGGALLGREAAIKAWNRRGSDSRFTLDPESGFVFDRENKEWLTTAEEVFDSMWDRRSK